MDLQFFEDIENIEEQLILLDHMNSQSQSHEEILSKFFSNMNNNDNNNNNIIDPSNNNDNDNKVVSSDALAAISGNTFLQQYHPQQQDLAEIGNTTFINIPFYFENNNVYSRDTFLNRYDQGLQNNNNINMLLQSKPDINYELNAQNTRFNPSTDNSHNQYDQNEWPATLPSHVSQIYHHHDMGLSQVILESPFPSPNLLTMAALPVPSCPLITFGDSQNLFNSRRSQTSSVYETEYQPRVTTSGSNLLSTSSLCSQKPPVYTKWTEEEDELLRAAISIYGPHKWSLIAAHVPNRTPMQCSTRWLGALNPTIHKGRWTPEEDAALKSAVSEYVDLLDSDGHPQPIPWNKIASHIPHRTGIQCQARWSEALDPSVRKGKWSPEEDEVLKEGVKRYGRCWIRIAELIEGRTQRQCRTRWVQIRNKQAKIERDAITAKAASEASSTDDESTPRPSTPVQPVQTTINHDQGQGLQLYMTAIPTIVPQVKNCPMSPTGTSATEESCVTTPENISSPYFDKPNHSNIYLCAPLH